MSALYRDEPTIEAMNLLGLDLNAVGNHEFDDGADFKFLAANVVRKDNAKTLFRPYSIRRFQGKQIGFIGMTSRGDAEHRLALRQRQPQLPRRGGNRQPLRQGAQAPARGEGDRRACTKAASRASPSTQTPPRTRGCTGLSGPVLDIVDNTADDVDMFITGHIHQPYNCVVDGRPVTSASSAGRLISDIDLTIGRNGDVKNVKATNLPMYAEGRTPLKSVDDLVKFYEDKSRPLRETTVGRIAANIARDLDPDGSRENALGS